MTKISVIVPTFNAAGTLRRCIESLLAQTVALHQIIIIDDGSTDESEAVAAMIARDNPTVEVYHQPNKGVSETRNRGISLATGEYIGFVDPDDTVRPAMYQTMLAAAEVYDVEVVSLRDYTIRARPTSGKDPGVTVLASDQARSELLSLTYPSGVWAHLYSKAIIEGIRFDIRIGFFEDLLFNFEALSKVDRVACLSGSLYNYEPGPDGANRAALNEKHLSSFLACDSIRDLIESESLAFHGELASLQATCIETVLYKVASSPTTSAWAERRVQDFARRAIRGCWSADTVSPYRTAMVLAASVSARIVFAAARVALRVRRSAVTGRIGRQ